MGKVSGVRSPGVAFFPLFSYSMFHLMLPREKHMQKGPMFVFNRMHWGATAQLKCFKCLCLKRGAAGHTGLVPFSDKLTPGFTTDGKRSWVGEQGRDRRDRHIDRDGGFRHETLETGRTHLTKRIPKTGPQNSTFWGWNTHPWPGWKLA